MGVPFYICTGFFLSFMLRPEILIQLSHLMYGRDILGEKDIKLKYSQCTIPMLGASRLGFGGGIYLLAYAIVHGCSTVMKVRVIGSSPLLGRTIIKALGMGRGSHSVTLHAFINGLEEVITIAPQGVDCRRNYFPIEFAVCQRMMMERYVSNPRPYLFEFLISDCSTNAPHDHHCRLEWIDNDLWVTPCLESNGTKLCQVNLIKCRITEESYNESIPVLAKTKISLGGTLIINEACPLRMDQVTLDLQKGGWVEYCAGPLEALMGVAFVLVIALWRISSLAESSLQG